MMRKLMGKKRRTNGQQNGEAASNRATEQNGGVAQSGPARTLVPGADCLPGPALTRGTPQSDHA